MHWSLKIGIFLIIIALLCFWAFYHGLVIRKYTVKSGKIGEDQEFRIVLISDLHSCIHGKEQSNLISKIKKQNPDLILLAGDIADDYTPIEGTRLFLEGIQNIAPIFYVSGNHEYWSGEIAEIKETIRSYGVIVLEDEYKEVQINDSKIVVAGVDDPEWVRYELKQGSAEQSMDAAFKDLSDIEGYKVLIAHRPEMIEVYRKYSFDLIVSGHAHGGQVRIPLILNGLYAPNQGWFPQHAGGTYKYGQLTHVVSRGMSYYSRLPRIFNPPEIVVIDVEP